ncbi:MULTISPECIES: DUF4180 domain-containing protein [unclassified Cryobacterium]|uniref:DUF4180 domain-containing protein n=1 Tax=unclassified Cryobacterium TaxID=2649013 RepID=UPI0014484648|nr:MULTISPECIES: DUF4180 domain-containing protein [unclassified Cryobacterium]
MTVEEIHGLQVQRVPADGPIIATGDQTSDLIGNAWYVHAQLLVVPARRFGTEFFDLSTGHAGEILQKLVNYGLKLAIIGDVSERERDSDAFAAFVWESNRADHVWFLPDEDALVAKLAGRAGAVS